MTEGNATHRVEPHRSRIAIRTVAPATRFSGLSHRRLAVGIVGAATKFSGFWGGEAVE